MKPGTPIHSFGYLMLHIAGVMHRQSDQILQERLGIGMSQFKILLILRSGDPVTQRTLAGILGQTEASISRQVKLLAEKGALTTRVNPRNRRQHITTITPKGGKLAEAALEVSAAYHGPVIEPLPAKQTHRLLSVLRDIHTRVCCKGKPHSCGHIFDI